MLKKLMITTAIGGLMMGGALAQTKPMDAPAETPPAATAPATNSEPYNAPRSTTGMGGGTPRPAPAVPAPAAR